MRFLKILSYPLSETKAKYQKISYPTLSQHATKIIMKQCTELPEWQALQAHHQAISDETMHRWFREDPLRFQQFSLQVGSLLLDYSKNRIKPETLLLFNQLAEAVHLSQHIQALFSGQPINTTENRPAHHTALRDDSKPEVIAAHQQMRRVTEQVRSGAWLGATGKPIRDIVNIGIGGSHLGPYLVTHALGNFATDRLRCHFLSRVDSEQLAVLLQQIDPEAALFIISSKSFTTLETLTNAEFIRDWLQQKIGSKNISRHFIAVTAAPEKAIAFGLPEAQIFPIWDWVGGRYSVWSAIGLPIAFMIGMDHFAEFLAGARLMDQHFQQAPLTENMPVIMALLGVWYINFFGATHHAIVPYAHRLSHLHSYLQQLDMESNGKQVTHQGKRVTYGTGPIIFGEHGSDGQHAFHQLLHQGPQFVPVDFILVGKNSQQDNAHLPLHDVLIASALSQAQALMQGKSYQTLFAELTASGMSEQDAQRLAMHKTIPGNRPSNILFLDQLTPFNLGTLLALYEHKIFVQGVIWNINSFDQWGVELGKQLLPDILAGFAKHGIVEQDASTAGLIAHYKNLRGSPFTSPLRER